MDALDIVEEETHLELTFFTTIIPLHNLQFFPCFYYLGLLHENILSFVKLFTMDILSFVFFSSIFNYANILKSFFFSLIFNYELLCLPFKSLFNQSYDKD